MDFASPEIPSAPGDMRAFLKATEVWAPTQDSMALELVGGDYGELTGLRDLSMQKRFAYDRGLPGKTWAKRRPLLIKTDSPEFERREVAQRAGITTAIGLPVFAGDYLMGVVVFLCGGDSDSLGAIELWHCDTNESYDMRFVDGHFGELSRFESIAKSTSFRKGTGLVGQVWERRRPVVLTDLGRSHRFIRAEGALEAGLTTGLGIPVTIEDGQDFIMTFLSARGTPIARQIEIWEPDTSRRSVTFAAGYSDSGLDLQERYRFVRIAVCDGLIGQVLLTGAPALSLKVQDSPAPAEANFRSVTAIPVLAQGRCQSIVVLYS